MLSAKDFTLPVRSVLWVERYTSPSGSLPNHLDRPISVRTIFRVELNLCRQQGESRYLRRGIEFAWIVDRRAGPRSAGKRAKARYRVIELAADRKRS